MKVFSNFTRYFFISYSILPHYLLLLKASHDYDEIEAFPRLNESKRVLYSDAVISLGNHISHLMMINFMITRSSSRITSPRGVVPIDKKHVCGAGIVTSFPTVTCKASRR